MNIWVWEYIRSGIQHLKSWNSYLQKTVYHGGGRRLLWALILASIIRRRVWDILKQVLRALMSMSDSIPEFIDGGHIDEVDFWTSRSPVISNTGRSIINLTC